MKSFYEMWRILSESSYYEAEKAAYEMAEKAFEKAGIPWDEDEWKALYGKWVDMEVYISPTATKRLQGVILPREIKEDEDHYGAYPRGFEVNHHKFDPTDIKEIHSIRVAEKLDDILDRWHDDRDYDATLRSLPY